MYEEQSLNLDALTSAINEVLAEKENIVKQLSEIDEVLIESLLLSEASTKDRTYTVRSLPVVNLAPEKLSVEGASKDKEALFQWIQQVKGSNLVEKLEGLQAYIENPDFDGGESGKKLEDLNAKELNLFTVKLMNHLYMIKILSTLIENFKSTTAGVMLEPVLAVLIGGEKRGERDTLVDIFGPLDGSDPVGISLKLVKSVAFSNSFTNLVNDLAEYDTINYVILHKNDKIEEQIDVYKFSLNYENVFDVLMAVQGEKNKYSLSYPSKPEKQELTDPEKQETKDEKIADLEEIKNRYNNLETKDEKIAMLKELQGYGAEGAKKGQFYLNRDQVIELSGELKAFGNIKYGTEYLNGVVNKYAKTVNRSIFNIFEDMAEMSERLHTFFANNLEDREEGRKGAAAGERAAKQVRRKFID